MALKMGIIGMGKMAEFHAGWMTPENGLELVAICERNEKRAAEVKQKYDVPVYTDSTAFFNHPGLDFVVVTTTNEAHSALAIQAMEHGKHVIVEKPMAMDYASTLRMVATAEKTKKHLFVHQSARWDRDFLLLHDVLKSGLLGDLLLIKQEVMMCDEGWPAWGIDGMTNPWRIKAQYGGGMLYDWGPHLIDWTLQLVKKDPINVYCILQQGYWSKDADDYCFGIMKFDGNLVCQFEAGNNARLPQDRFYVVGTKGTFLVKGKQIPVWDEAEMEYVKDNGERVHQSWKLIGAQESGIEGGFYRQLVPYLEGKVSDFVTMYDGSKVLKVLELMQISNRENRVVRWEEL
jgi:scyllo-inositol 2-dehydrogenase (NADP+)